MLDKPRIFTELATINFKYKLHHPWIILVRICAMSIPAPSKVKNVRIHKIDQNAILIAWNDSEYNNKRCIQTYEIFYKHKIDEQWRSIAHNKHISFLSYVHHSSEPLQGIILIWFSRGRRLFIISTFIYYRILQNTWNGYVQSLWWIFENL